jgi:biopolymer transport protein ExbD
MSPRRHPRASFPSAVRLIRTLALAAFASATLPAAPDVLFKGYLANGAHSQFVLTVDGETSDWLTVGRTFHGYTIVAFEPKTSTLTVEKDHRREALPLVDSRVREGKSSVHDVRNTASASAAKPLVVKVGDLAPLSIEPGNRDQLENLKKQLAALAKQVPQPPITIRANASTKAADISAVMSAVHAAGFTRFSLSTGQ